MQIMLAIKKAILSLNLTYKWKLLRFKEIMIVFHLFLFISSIASNLKDKYESNKNITSINFNDFNITLNNNNSINNENKYENYSYIDNNNTYFDYSSIKERNKKTLFFKIIISQIILIPIWLNFIFNIKPKWDEINDILYKFTNYLLFCEYYENNCYFYYLMKDFTILITTKEYFFILY